MNLDTFEEASPEIMGSLSVITLEVNGRSHTLDLDPATPFSMR